MDCNGCGRDCNTLGSGGDPNTIEKIFAEFLGSGKGRWKICCEKFKAIQSFEV
jgi:hypothetical protein